MGENKVDANRYDPPAQARAEAEWLKEQWNFEQSDARMRHAGTLFDMGLITDDQLEQLTKASSKGVFLQLLQTFGVGS